MVFGLSPLLRIFVLGGGRVFVVKRTISFFSSEVSLPLATVDDVLEGHWTKTRRKALQMDD